jgi:hypothetical protein
MASSLVADDASLVGTSLFAWEHSGKRSEIEIVVAASATRVAIAGRDGGRYGHSFAAPCLQPDDTGLMMHFFIDASSGQIQHWLFILQ